MAKPTGLTVIEIAALKPRAKPYEVRDPAVIGAYVVIWPSGAKSYVLRYRFHGKSRKHTVGPFDPKGKGELARIRADAMKAAADLADARSPLSATTLDPAAAKKGARKAKAVAVREAVREVEQGAAEEFGAVLAQFTERHLSKLRTGRAVARALELNLSPRWKGRRLSEITRADVHDVLDAIVDRGAAIQANRVRAYLSKLFAWARSRGLVEHNPVEGIEPPTGENHRERVLDENELALIWRAARHIGWPFGDIVRLLILTGQRKSEIACGEWSEIDFDKALWSLPAARVKNKRAHTIPLAPQAIAILAASPRVAGSKYAFTTTGDNPVSGFSKWKSALDAKIAELNDGTEIESWGLHDLRHAAAMGMQRLGVAPHVIEKVLNHVSGTFRGIAGVYQRHAYEDEKRDALQRWADHVEQVVAISGEAEDEDDTELETNNFFAGVE